MVATFGGGGGRLWGGDISPRDTGGRQGRAWGGQRGGQSCACVLGLWLLFCKIILFLSVSYDKKREGINLYKRLIYRNLAKYLSDKKGDIK